MLRQVFSNLISNALKFSREKQGAIIRVGGRRDGAVVTFSVSDNGPGFDPADAAQLFEAFVRLKPAEKVEGHGIGLSIVQRIVERHGGRAWATAAPGQGATFCFSLPQGADPSPLGDE